jgi:hypothetical protein
MSAPVAMQPMAAAAGLSPRVKARMAGVLYVLGGVSSGLAQFFLLPRLVASGDAAATAATILAHEPLFWLVFTLNLVAVAFHVAWAALFYDLFRPVSRSLSLLAAFVLLVGCALLAVSSLLQVAPLVVLHDGSSVSAFTAPQEQALALALLKVSAQAYNIFLVFFGLYLLVIGILIIRSTFMPWILGVLEAAAGLGYLTLLFPPLAQALSPYNLAPAALGEPALMLWLLVVGVNDQRWKAQASTANVGISDLGAPGRTAV